MGIELALILGVMGIAYSGSLLSLNLGFSIRGITNGDGLDNTLGNLLGLLDISENSFAVYKNNRGDLEYCKGYKTILENWYRTKVDYGLVQLNLDIVDWVTKHLELGRIGGNTGTVNSFALLNLDNYSGGVLNTAELLENNDLLYFAFEVLKAFAPNSLSPLLSIIGTALGMITDVLSASLLSLTCPEWDDPTKNGDQLWNDIQGKFPGARR